MTVDTAETEPKLGDPSDVESGDSPGVSPAKSTHHAGPFRGPLWQNTVTLVGFFCVLVSLMLLLTFGLFTIVAPTTNPYVDIVGYLILPTILIVGLILMPFGILFKSWRVKRRDPTQHLAFRFPRVNLNDPQQRMVAKFFMGGSFIMLPVIGVSSYQGYHYTDSTEFCAKACHEVMEPQGTAYATSPHARVACAECHIGTGASWFVKAKLSGTRQVLAVALNTFSRPIPPAIEQLRPARETCEQCHWPRKFFGAQLREIVHFNSNEENTRRDMAMLVKTGGGDETTGRAEGIHMHMALAAQVNYVATDPKLQTIPWVQLTDSEGVTTIYRSDGLSSSDPKPEGELRHMDCMDCHNRPAHHFQSPEEAVDLRMGTGHIDTTLPFIKRKAVEVLAAGYPDKDTAMIQIERKLLDFYQNKYPEQWKTKKDAITRTVDVVKDIYRSTFFPDMKVDWRTYPDNIGHKIFPGCFRCHDGKHVNDKGDPINSACDTCHTFLRDTGAGSGSAVLHEGPFVHSVELKGPHATLRCDQCHTGGKSMEPTCAGCHSQVRQFRTGTLPAFSAFAISPDAMAGSVDCETCHDFGKPTTLVALQETCMDCHDDDEEKYDGILQRWADEAAPLIERCESECNEQGRKTLRELQKAGLYHNFEATRTILKSLVSQPHGEPDAH